jgi:hypothetical protein
VKKKLETARNMLAEGLALPLIIKITGLTQAPNPATGSLPKCSLAYPINSSAGPFGMEKYFIIAFRILGEALPSPYGFTALAIF